MKESKKKVTDLVADIRNKLTPITTVMFLARDLQVNPKLFDLADNCLNKILENLQLIEEENNIER